MSSVCCISKCLYKLSVLIHEMTWTHECSIRVIYYNLITVMEPLTVLLDYIDQSNLDSVRAENTGDSFAETGFL